VSRRYPAGSETIRRLRGERVFSHVEIRPSSQEFAMRLHPLPVAFAMSLSTAFASAVDNSSEAIQMELAKAKTAHAAAIKLASEKLSAAVDAEIETVRKSSLKAELRIRVIGIMEKEKELFEKSGWIPVSDRLQKISIAYMKQLNAADKSLDSPYEKYISLLLKAKDTDGAKKVLEEKKKDLPRRLMICFEMEDGSYWKCYSDETTGDAKQRWRFVKGEIVFDFPPSTPNGKSMFDIAMVISEDGQSFHCVRDRKYTAKRVDAPRK
jgi:hypothetical protein